jgi:hypothetical protein
VLNAWDSAAIFFQASTSFGIEISINTTYAACSMPATGGNLCEPVSNTWYSESFAPFNATLQLSPRRGTLITKSGFRTTATRLGSASGETRIAAALPSSPTVGIVSRFVASLFTCDRDSIYRKRSPFFGPERFTYEPENNRYICPAGQFLNYSGRVYRNRAFNYIGTRKSVVRARSGHKAPVLPSGALSSTRTNQPDNVRGSWSTRQSSPKHSGKERRWKPCSRN